MNMKKCLKKYRWSCLDAWQKVSLLLIGVAIIHILSPVPGKIEPELQGWFLLDETAFYLLFIAAIILWIAGPLLRDFMSPLEGSQESFQKPLNRAERKLRKVGLINSAKGPSKECVPYISLIAEENRKLAVAYMTIEIKKIFEFKGNKYNDKESDALKELILTLEDGIEEEEIDEKTAKNIIDIGCNVINTLKDRIK